MAGRTSVRRPGQIQEKAPTPTAAGREALTRCFELSVYLLDAEEVRHSNPLAPTAKGPDHSTFSFSAGFAESGLRGPEVDEKLTRRVGDDLKLSAGSRNGARRQAVGSQLLDVAAGSGNVAVISGSTGPADGRAPRAENRW